MRVKTPVSMFRSPDRFVSDGRFTPEGTVQFRHLLSIDGESARFYCDTDLTQSLNGLRDQLDKNKPVEVIAEIDLGVQANKLIARDLIGLEAPAGK